MAFKAEKMMKQNNMDSVCWLRIWPCHRVTLPGGTGPAGSPNKTSPPTSLVPGGTGIYCTRKLPFYLLMLFICLCNYIALINLFLQSVLGIHFCLGFVIASKLDLLWYLVWDEKSKLILFQTAASLRILQWLPVSYSRLLVYHILIYYLLILILHSASKLVLVTTFLYPQFQNPLFPFHFFPWKL